MIKSNELNNVTIEVFPLVEHMLNSFSVNKFKTGFSMDLIISIYKPRKHYLSLFSVTAFSMKLNKGQLNKYIQSEKK